MPTVLRVDGYRFFFYSNESNEPPHIHVEKGGKLAKFWLAPVSLANTTGFNNSELRHIERIILEYSNQLKEAWYEFFK